MLDIKEIMELLPHRYPFLMVDRILEVVPDKTAVGIKNVTMNEPYFQGHFPGLPTMPGVLIMESMAQVGGIMLMTARRGQDLVTYFGGVESFRWKRPVYPGDTLKITVTMLKSRGNIGKVKAVAEVDGNVAALGEMSFALVPRNEVK